MRFPSQEECRVLGQLIRSAGIECDVATLEVESMSDGGMGSLALGGGHSARRFGRAVSEVQFKDTDDVLVIATLHLDSDDQPYEMDVFKTDFSPTEAFKSTHNQAKHGDR